jgi:hypothetical protein
LPKIARFEQEARHEEKRNSSRIESHQKTRPEASDGYHLQRDPSIGSRLPIFEHPTKMADEMDQIRGTKFQYHSDSEGETEREEEYIVDEEDVYVVAMDDEFKLQLCLGAVDTLSNTLAFQNWLTVTQSVSSPSSQPVRKLQRSWRVNDDSHDFIIQWKKYKKRTSYTRQKYRTYEDEEQNSSSDDDDSDEEAERVNDDPTVTVLEYFTVATQSNLSHTVKLDEDLLTLLPPSAPTSTREMVRKNMGLVLQADGLFNALSFTLMIAGAFVSSSRSTVSKTAVANTTTASTSTTISTTTTPSKTTKRGYRRWAQLAIPVNERHDGFQYILVDTAPIEDLDCTLNSVVNATFAVAERVHVPDMITSVTTCLTRRGIPFEYKRAAQDDFGENDEPHPPSQRRRNSTGMIPPQMKKILKEEELDQLIICRQGLVDNTSKKSATSGGASEADAAATATPGLVTQFEFDPHGQLRDIGLAFG